MPSHPIQQLSPALVNRIAAGEVIERPASVVKELVENSIDAGASHIRVEIEQGGIELVRVIDDGDGIPAEELALAMAAHATSKLQSDDDLQRIATMGFRGEALASIGAVSHTRLVSRTAGQTITHEIINHGGQIEGPRAAAGNAGSVIEVRTLFYNTPARRKFLKGPPTEFGHVSETLLRLAVARPDIAFSLSHNGKPGLELPASAASQRQLAAWPREFAELSLPILAQFESLAIEGLLGLPELARPTAKYQYFFLNGRPIRDRFLQHALREAYRGLMEPGRQPAAILLLRMDPAMVDVNVHPTKSEVRFRDSGAVHGMVLSAVREKLLSSNLAPAAVARTATLGDPAEHRELREKLADFFRAGSGMPALQQPPWSLQNSAAPQPGFPMDERARATPAQPFAEAAPDFPTGPSPIEDPAAGSPAALQLHNSYLVVESEDGLVIIDQHALHERILYEELLARLSRGPLESQRLLIPVTVAATPAQLEVLGQIQPLLAKLGIEAQPIGPDALAVHAFPSFLHRLDPGVFLAQVLERGEQESLDVHHEELLHEILDMMACKAAVKAGDPLTAAEIESLLARRHLVDRSSNCPHGRPTTLRLTLHDLEKQFKRTGF